MEEFAAEIQELGRRARTGLGAEDVKRFKRLKLAARAAEAGGRLCLVAAATPWTCLLGALSLAFSFSVEAQLNHSAMHGSYAGLPGAENLAPLRYETLAVPFQSRTWGEAHRIHHSNPSLLELDPDTAHPLFRVHADQPWRPWHVLNGILGSLFTFEIWAFDYDLFLKKRGFRAEDDRTERKKLALFFIYQYVLFAALAGPRWKTMVLATLSASVIRNLIFTGLQTGSSVGAGVSTRHHRSVGPKKMGDWYRFQAETSKNFALHGIWKALCGGLDRHIEHHLYPNLPPERLHALSPEIRALCRSHGVAYEEYPTFWRSLGDSLSHLTRLSSPAATS